MTLVTIVFQFGLSLAELFINEEYTVIGFSDGSVGKESACNAGDMGLIPGLGRSAGEGNGNLLLYYSLENPMDRGTWQATVQGVAKSWTQLSDFTFISFLNTKLGEDRVLLYLGDQSILGLQHKVGAL